MDFWRRSFVVVGGGRDRSLGLVGDDDEGLGNDN